MHLLNGKISIMKIDIRQQLLDYRGKPIEEGENKTLRDFVAIALNNATGAEVLTGEQKAKAYQITTKLYQKNKVELTLDERAFVKERVEKIMPVLHAGRIVDVLEERPILPILADEEGEDKEDGMVVKNANLSNAAAKDESEPPIKPAKKR
jgi:hypothetical protein